MNCYKRSRMRRRSKPINFLSVLERLVPLNLYRKFEGVQSNTKEKEDNEVFFNTLLNAFYL